MKRMCRRIAAATWRRRQLAVTELLRNARIVTDPIKLASLKQKLSGGNQEATATPSTSLVSHSYGPCTVLNNWHRQYSAK
jgi:hypothetical protein